jgi:isochorismate synthase
MKLTGPALSFDMPPTAASPRGSSPICWSTKNVQEQHYVATYLSEQLRPFVCDLHEEGPCTVRAANLVHLRSDFTFTLLNNARVGDVLQALHPTPAVCGLPKDEAFDFILHHEHTPRQYYSGFLGPLNIPATTQQPTPATHLYVSLRCMQITATHYRLYAGGGLLKDSQEEQEWAETEAKMETMRHCIG